MLPLAASFARWLSPYCGVRRRQPVGTKVGAGRHQKGVAWCLPATLAKGIIAGVPAETNWKNKKARAEAASPDPAARPPKRAGGSCWLALRLDHFRRLPKMVDVSPLLKHRGHGPGCRCPPTPA